MEFYRAKPFKVCFDRVLSCLTAMHTQVTASVGAGQSVSGEVHVRGRNYKPTQPKPRAPDGSFRASIAVSDRDPDDAPMTEASPGRLLIDISQSRHRRLRKQALALLSGTPSQVDMTNAEKLLAAAFDIVAKAPDQPELTQVRSEIKLLWQILGI